MLFQHFSLSAAFELEQGKFRVGSDARSGVTLIREQGAAGAARAMAGVQHMLPLEQEPQRAPRTRQQRQLLSASWDIMPGTAPWKELAPAVDW